MAPKNCLSTQIINPVTGRCVKKDGKIGKQVVAVQSALITTAMPTSLLLPMNFKALKKNANKFKDQMNMDFLKLSEDQQLKALESQSISDIIDITTIFVKTPFPSIWKKILDQHGADLNDLDLFDDQSLSKERKRELIYTVGTQADCDHIFNDIYDLAYENDKIFELVNGYMEDIILNDTYIGQIRDINTYYKLLGNLINFYNLVFKVHNETFKFLLDKYTDKLRDLDIDELGHIINQPDHADNISIREKNQRLKEIIKLQD